MSFTKGVEVPRHRYATHNVLRHQRLFNALSIDFFNAARLSRTVVLTNVFVLWNKGVWIANSAEQVVREGKLLGIFIEGTRSKTGEFLRPKSGAAIIAQQMQVPVIPVCITPKNKQVKVFQKVTISIGTPMTPQELGLTNGGGAEYRNASRKMMAEIQKMREHDLT